MVNVDKFDAEILKDVGDVEISNTQKLRVLVVRDETKKIRIAAQKWWRKDIESDWRSGKGFFLTGRQASELGHLLVETGRALLHVR